MPAAAAGLTADGQRRFEALKAWRAEVAREHNLPAYVIFHDATLAAIAALDPRSVRELEGISGIGAAKLEKYGPGVLDVLQATGEAFSESTSTPSPTGTIAICTSALERDRTPARFGPFASRLDPLPALLLRAPAAIPAPRSGSAA